MLINPWHNLEIALIKLNANVLLNIVFIYNNHFIFLKIIFRSLFHYVKLMKNFFLDGFQTIRMNEIQHFYIILLFYTYIYFLKKLESTRVLCFIIIKLSIFSILFLSYSFIRLNILLKFRWLKLTILHLKNTIIN